MLSIHTGNSALWLKKNMFPPLFQVDIYAEIGEIMAGSKALPEVPDCGKKYYLFKSLGKRS